VPDIDTRPTVINIEHYGGDTLSLHVTIDPLVEAGRTWTAQVRSLPFTPRLSEAGRILRHLPGQHRSLRGAVR